jgi:hypothetical protein
MYTFFERRLRKRARCPGTHLVDLGLARLAAVAAHVKRRLVVTASTRTASVSGKLWFALKDRREPTSDICSVSTVVTQHDWQRDKRQCTRDRDEHFEHRFCHNQEPSVNKRNQLSLEMERPLAGAYARRRLWSEECRARIPSHSLFCRTGIACNLFRTNSC